MADPALDPLLADRFSQLRRVLPQVGAAEVGDFLTDARSVSDVPRRWGRRRILMPLIAVAILLVGAVAASGAGFPSLPGMIRSLGDGEVVRSRPVHPAMGLVAVSLAKSGDDVEANWRALIIASGYKDQGGKERAFEITSGTSIQSWEQLPNIPPAKGLLSAAQTERLIQRNLPRLGWKPLKVELLKPHGYAPLVVAEVFDPRKISNNWLINRGNAAMAVFGFVPPPCGNTCGVEPRRQRLDGYFLRLVDPQGRLILETGWAARLGEGIGQVGPHYQHRIGE